MQRPRVRFTLRTVMIMVAVIAAAFALFSARWNRPGPVAPFDAIEMFGPGRVPAEIGKE